VRCNEKEKERERERKSKRKKKREKERVIALQELVEFFQTSFITKIKRYKYLKNKLI